MARPLTLASLAWTIAVLAAAAGVVLPSNQQRLSFGLFAFAVAVGLLVGLLLIADGLRHRKARRRTNLARADSPLVRLEYLPAVTSRTRRISWRGGRYLVSRGNPASQSPAAELTGSAYPPPASSTRPPQTDEVAAGPRAS